jgi:3-oxoadipate enol-lactonase
MIAYEVAGSGEPLLMIMGLSSTRRAWWRLLPHLTPHAECITFDNRGTGESEPVRGRLTMADMVDDALGVLDRAGHASAHVIGVSMGGMIAQHLALDHRERVRSLILGCTTPRGSSGAPPWRLLAATALRPLVGVGRSAGLVEPALYGERIRREHPDRVREDLERRVQDSTGVQTSIAQMLAISGHDTRARLAELAGLEVTVIHGEDDALVPCRHGRELAAGIPGARLITIPGCGHMMTTDAEDEAAAAVIGHLRSAAGAAHAAYGERA